MPSKDGAVSSEVAKAIDTGYNLVIILAGLTNKLRKQTQSRMQKDLVDRLRDRFWNGAAEQDGGTRERKQGQRVAEPPGQSMLDDVADMGAARGDAGDGRDMIGLERVLYAEQKTKPQNSEHAALPA